MNKDINYEEVFNRLKGRKYFQFYNHVLLIPISFDDKGVNFRTELKGVTTSYLCSYLTKLNRFECELLKEAKHETP